VATLEVVIGGTVLLGEGFGVCNKFVGFALKEGEEILAGHAEGVVNKAVEVSIVPKGDDAP
jgi:hypothetical protein